MKKILTAASLLVLLSGCGGGGGGGTDTASATDTSSGTTDSTSTTDSAKITSASEIVASPKFDFAASRTIDIDFDVPEARSAEGMLSLCNDYTKTGDSYDINYNSCTVQAKLVNGVYSSKMELTNDVNAIVGVVWFTDPNIAPVYKEFSVENTAGRAARGAGGSQATTISWK